MYLWSTENIEYGGIRNDIKRALGGRGPQNMHFGKLKSLSSIAKIKLAFSSTLCYNDYRNKL